jgi:hypothetical protein
MVSSDDKNLDEASTNKKSEELISHAGRITREHIPAHYGEQVVILALERPLRATEIKRLSGAKSMISTRQNHWETC